MDHAALVERGLHEFDAWASTFGDTSTELELQPSGKYRPVTRFAQFVNVPELIAMFRSFADVVLPDDLKDYVKVPAVAGGKRQIITAEATAAFNAYQRLLDERIKAIEERDRAPEPGDDILLSVITDGRHAAIDLRLVDSGQENEEGNKLNALIANAFRIWQETSGGTYLRKDGKAFDKPGAGQLIFSDLGTISVEASRGFSAYRWIRDELVRLGVPPSEIAYMQDHTKSEAKQRLFNDFNAGKVRILLGSSDTMGTGVNVQLRMKALHHLDVPWLPRRSSSARAVSCARATSMTRSKSSPTPRSAASMPPCGKTMSARPVSSPRRCQAIRACGAWRTWAKARPTSSPWPRRLHPAIHA